MSGLGVMLSSMISKQEGAFSISMRLASLAFSRWSSRSS
jgi:hypothetical protein